MFCEQCGKQIEDMDRFCPFCGAPADGGRNAEIFQDEPERLSHHPAFASAGMKGLEKGKTLVNRMSGNQFIVGLVLLGLFLIGSLLPKFTMEFDMGLSIMKVFHANRDLIRENYGENVKEKDLDKYFEKFNEEYRISIDRYKENGSAVSYSIFYMIFINYQKDQMQRANVDRERDGEEAYHTIREYRYDLSDSQKENLEAQTRNWQKMKIAYAILMSGFLFIVVSMILVRTGRFQKNVPIFSIWATAIYYLIMHILYYSGTWIIGDSLFGYQGSMQELSVAKELIRKILWDSTGSGFWVCSVAMILLVVWSIWNFRMKGDFVQLQAVQWEKTPRPMVSDIAVPPSDEILPVDDMWDEEGLDETIYMGYGNSAVNALIPQIRCIHGELSGTSVSFKEKSSIVIGRDPGKSDITLKNPVISREHCKVSWFPEKERFQVECYSKNGVLISNKQRILEDQSALASFGDQLILAMGEEVFLLEKKS